MERRECGEGVERRPYPLSSLGQQEHRTLVSVSEKSLQLHNQTKETSEDLK